MREPKRSLEWPAIVHDIIAQTDAPDRLYLVGGIVRDALLDRHSLDIDLATPDNGLKLARQLADRLDGAYYPVDKERRTGRILLDDVQIDIASFRGESLDEDLRLRDFTINAMACRMDHPHLLIDPLGGEEDLFAYRVIRQCSPASISNDPIRALRAIRQATQLTLRIEPKTIHAIREYGPTLLGDPQPERIRDEVFKMLGKGEADAALKLMDALGLIGVMVPGEIDPAVFEQRMVVVEQLERLITIISPQRDDNTASDLTLGVAVMILDRYRRQLQEHLAQTFANERPRRSLLHLTALDAASAEEWAAWLHLSNEEKHTIEQIYAAMDFTVSGPDLTDYDIHYYYREAGEAGIDGVLIMLAEYLAAEWPKPAPKAWGDLLEHTAAPMLEGFFRRYQEVVAPPPLLTGNDLIEEVGAAPGPQIGEVLADLLAEQAAGVVTTRDEALAYARQRLIG